MASGSAMQARRTGRKRRRAALALVAALGAHALVLALLPHLDLGSLSATSATKVSSATSTKDDSPIELSSLVETLAEPDAPTPEALKREEQAKKEEEQKTPNGQVVDIARPAIEERPDDARYVSEYDSKVDRETKSQRGHDKAGSKVAHEAAPSTPPSGAASAHEATRGGRPGQAQEAPKVAMIQPSRGHQGEAPDEDGTMRRETGRGRDGAERSTGATPVPRPSGEVGERGDGREAAPAAPAGAPRPNLTASREMLERVIGAGAGSSDYLKDVDDGESTALNAKRWKHAPFFNRLKRAVAQEWHPDMVYVRNDPSGNVYGVKDRVTVLRVHITPDGKLTGSNVIQSSGVGFLDDEAQEAFRRAQPFANPPKELVEGDGLIHFSFAFIFELSGRTSFKVYKYK